MSDLESLKYSKEHEWVRLEGDIATIGVTQYAAESLGDVVYVELPENDSKLEQFAKFGEIESVKAVSDLFSPVSGQVVEVNAALTVTPDVVNNDPYGEGWLVKVQLSNPSELDELLDADSYNKLIAE